MLEVHRKYYYRVELHGPLERVEFLSRVNASATWLLAEAAAEHFHNQGDGWECEWPLDFELFSFDGQSLGVWSVQRESLPVFSAHPKKEER